MSDPKLIKEIQAAVTIPVMAKARIGHFVECQVWSFFGSSNLKNYPNILWSIPSCQAALTVYIDP